MKKFLLIIATGLGASPAYADRGAADACAAGLSANSKAIYAAAVGQVHPGADNKAIVKGIVENMVSSGQLGMLNAKSEAQAAGVCLKKL